MFNVSKSIEAQRNYCDEKELPHFAPRDGRCWRCGKNIYTPVEHERRNWKTGEFEGTYTTEIEVEEAGTSLVTGCPHCNRSYCD